MARSLASKSARHPAVAGSSPALVTALLLIFGWTCSAVAETGDPSTAAPSAASPAASPADAPPVEAAPAERAPATPAPREPAILPGLPVSPNVPSPEGLGRALAAWNAHIKAGNADLKARRYLAAEKHFRAALVLDPSEPAQLAGLAESLDGLGLRRQATITLRKAVSLAIARAAQAEGWAAVARNAESRGMTTEALEAWMRVRSLSATPDPAIDARLANLRKAAPVVLMSPRTLCPQLLDDWGCAPSTRPAEGELRCECTIERHIRTPAAIDGGIRAVDEFGLARLEQHTLLAAAIIRLRGAGTSIVDARHLAVETGSGGWQLVARVVEGWQPGAAYTARDGALSEFGFSPLVDAGPEAETAGPALVVRSVNRYAEASFGDQLIFRVRVERAVICHAVGGLRCVQLVTARQISGRPMPGTSGTPIEEAWALDARFRPDGAWVVGSSSGALPPQQAPLVGTHPLETLDTLPTAIVTPLR